MSGQRCSCCDLDLDECPNLGIGEDREDMRAQLAAALARAEQAERCREVLAGLVEAYGVRHRRPDEEYPGCHSLVVLGPYGDWLECWRAALAALEESNG